MLTHYSSRLTRLDQAFLYEKLKHARRYRRIAGYFRSSLFEIAAEALEGVEQIQIVCNSEVDPHDVKVSRAVREQALKAQWNQLPIATESLLYRERYRRLYALLDSGRVDEAHRAQRCGGLGKNSGEANHLLSFIQTAAARSRHVLLGTATPVQTEGAEHVLGRMGSVWKRVDAALDLVTGAEQPLEPARYWELLRNPLPPKTTDPLFDAIRIDLGLADHTHFTDRSLTDLDEFNRGAGHQIDGIYRAKTARQCL